MNIHPKETAAAVRDLELSDLDLRYQGHRLQQPRLEEQLLASIARVGIQEPLQGIHHDSGHPISWLRFGERDGVHFG